MRASRRGEPRPITGAAFHPGAPEKRAPMPLRPEYSLCHSEFNDFLFAVVGEEKSGAQLTVLSALARLDLDPWGEASRLTGLPEEAATNALADTILSLPDGNWKASDVRSIAGGLINRLPRQVSSLAKQSLGSNIGAQKPLSDVQKWLPWIGFALTVFMVLSRLFGE